jgi:hypothetical protein
MISGLELWLQYFSRSVFLMTHWWTLASSWDLGLGSSPSHYGTPTPKNQNYLCTEGPDFHGTSRFVGTYEIKLWDVVWRGRRQVTIQNQPNSAHSLDQHRLGSVFFSCSKISHFLKPKMRIDESHKMNFFLFVPHFDPWVFSASLQWRQHIDMCHPLSPLRNWLIVRINVGHQIAGL